MPFCAAITGARGARWLQRSTCAASSSLTASRTSSFGREAWIPACSSPAAATHLPGPRPIWLYAGRVAVEKNLDAFLALDLPGSKVVVGDGPDRAALEERYRGARFVGYKFGADLARHLSSADVFVFPSRTDTFGLVMLEAIACGTPVAAYPVTGPIDVIAAGVSGVLDEDLRQAALRALKLDRASCALTALERTWPRATQQFLSHLVCARTGERLL